MPVCTGTDRLAGLIPRSFTPFSKCRIPKLTGYGIFFCAPACGGQPTQKGTAERLSPGGMRRTTSSRHALPKATHKKVASLSPGACGGNRPASCRSPAKRPYAHRVAGLRSRAPSHLLRKKGQPYGCPLGVSVLGRIRAPCSGSPSDGGSGGLQTALPVYFPPASCRPPGRSHGWQPPGQSPSHG